MNKRIRLVSAGLICLAGLALFTVRTDREFINLTPSPGSTENSLTLEASRAYEQKFPATRTSISRLGLYLRPQTRNLTPSAVSLSILASGQLRAQEKIPTSFIDAEGVSEIRLSRPVTVTRGEEITIVLDVPSELSGQIRALTRTPDETFNADYAHFTIDQTAHAAPLAYQVYYRYRPPLAWQMGGLLLIWALAVLFPQRLGSRKIIVLLGFSLAILYAAPAFLFGSFPLLLIGVTTLAFTGMALTLIRQKLSLPAVLAGACLFAFTTWWPLHFAYDWHWTSEVLGQATSLQNIFLDSNQVPSANGGQFEHYGSYLGMIAAGISLIGAATTIRKKRYWPYLALTLLSPLTAILLPDLVILTTFGLAFLAAQGLSALQSSLGKDKFVAALCWIIAMIVLLDLFHVGAGTLEFPLL